MSTIPGRTKVGRQVKGVSAAGGSASMGNEYLLLAGGGGMSQEW